MKPFIVLTATVTAFAFTVPALPWLGVAVTMAIGSEASKSIGMVHAWSKLNPSPMNTKKK